MQQSWFLQKTQPLRKTHSWNRKPRSPNERWSILVFWGVRSWQEFHLFGVTFTALAYHLSNSPFYWRPKKHNKSWILRFGKVWEASITRNGLRNKTAIVINHSCSTDLSIYHTHAKTLLQQFDKNYRNYQSTRLRLCCIVLLCDMRCYSLSADANEGASQKTCTNGRQSKWDRSEFGVKLLWHFPGTMWHDAVN